MPVNADPPMFISTRLLLRRRHKPILDAINRDPSTFLGDAGRIHHAGVIVELDKPRHDEGATLWAEFLKCRLGLRDGQRLVLGIGELRRADHSERVFETGKRRPLGWGGPGVARERPTLGGTVPRRCPAMSGNGLEKLPPRLGQKSLT